MTKIKISQPSLDQNERAAVLRVLDSFWLTQGPETEGFEKEFASFHRAPYGLAISSCTTGLELALKALELQQGDEVIIPCFSWVATANAVELANGTPVMVDINLDSFNTDSSKILDAVTERTKAVIPVHLFGQCVNTKALREALPPHIRIIEDAACASGSTYEGFYPGEHSDASVFSFHPRKVITTGEGGMILTKDKKLFDKIKQLRNHGLSGLNATDESSIFKHISDVSVVGHNYRMTDIQACVGRAQLEKLNNFVQERNELASHYLSALSDIDWLQLPKTIKDYTHSWQSFVVLRHTQANKASVPTRNQIIELLQNQGIETRPGTQLIPSLSYYKEKYFKDTNISEKFKNGWTVANESISLPMFNGLTKSDIDQVARSLKSL